MRPLLPSRLRFALVGVTQDLDDLHSWLKMNLGWKYYCALGDRNSSFTLLCIKGDETLAGTTVQTVDSACEVDVVIFYFIKYTCALNRLSVSAEVQVPGWGDAPLGAQPSTSGSREKCRDASYEWQKPRCHGGNTRLHTSHTYLSCQGRQHTHALLSITWHCYCTAALSCRHTMAWC